MRRITALATTACLLAIPAVAQPAGNDRMATAAQLRDAALAGNKAWGLLSNLTDTVGQRLAGTEAEARGRAWAKAEMQKLAEAVRQLESEIPPDIAWVLRVDGHTDADPIQSAQFRSNWELSAARAIAVVNFLIANGVSPQPLVAAGFGEFQPIDPGSTEEAKSRNRRIELKLTER